MAEVYEEITFSEQFTSANMNRASSDMTKRHPGWTIGLGVVAVVIGLYGLFNFVALSIASMVALGAILWVAAIVFAVHTFMAKRWNYAALDLLAAVLFAVLGTMVIRHPLSSLASLTLMIGTLYMMLGIFRFIGAIATKPMHRGIILFDGIVCFILGSMVVWQWPASSFWLIGLLVSVDLLISGAGLIMVGSSVSRLVKRTTAPENFRPSPV